MADRVEALVSGWQARRTVGPYWDIVSAQSAADRNVAVQYGIRPETWQITSRTGTKVAEYFYLVRGGLKHARYLYQGVQRRMKFGADMNADEKILAYVWQPEFSYEWVGGRDSRAFPNKAPAPPNVVFGVLVRPHEQDEHETQGTILTWNWIDGDATGRPIDCADRYSKLIWG